MFPDWGHEWPLWENSTPTHDYGYTMDPSDYSLSESLTAELRRWYDDWERCMRPSERPHWVGEPTEDAWEKEGLRIAELLRAEVAAFADVKYEN